MAFQWGNFSWWLDDELWYQEPSGNREDPSVPEFKRDEDRRYDSRLIVVEPSDLPKNAEINNVSEVANDSGYGDLSYNFESTVNYDNENNVYNEQDYTTANNSKDFWVNNGSNNTSTIDNDTRIIDIGRNTNEYIDNAAKEMKRKRKSSIESNVESKKVKILSNEHVYVGNITADSAKNYLSSSENSAAYTIIEEVQNNEHGLNTMIKQEGGRNGTNAYVDTNPERSFVFKLGTDDTNIELNVSNHNIANHLNNLESNISHEVTVQDRNKEHVIDTSCINPGSNSSNAFIDSAANSNFGGNFEPDLNLKAFDYSNVTSIANSEASNDFAHPDSGLSGFSSCVEDSAEVPSPNKSFKADKSFKNRKNHRTSYTDRQKMVLEREYASDHYLKPERREELAKELGLNDIQLNTWFQNRRSKEKREQMKSEEDGTMSGVRNDQEEQGIFTLPHPTTTPSSYKNGSKSHLPKKSALPKKTTGNRTMFTDKQKAILESEYKTDPKLDYVRRAEIAKSLGLKESCIKNWFQNKRSNQKKESESLLQGGYEPDSTLDHVSEIQAPMEIVQECQIHGQSSTTFSQPHTVPQTDAFLSTNDIPTSSECSSFNNPVATGLTTLVFIGASEKPVANTMRPLKSVSIPPNSQYNKEDFSSSTNNHAHNSEDQYGLTYEAVKYHHPFEGNETKDVNLIERSPQHLELNQTNPPNKRLIVKNRSRDPMWNGCDISDLSEEETVPDTVTTRNLFEQNAYTMRETSPKHQISFKILQNTHGAGTFPLTDESISINFDNAGNISKPVPYTQSSNNISFTQNVEAMTLNVPFNATSSTAYNQEQISSGGEKENEIELLENNSLENIVLDLFDVDFEQSLIPPSARLNLEYPSFDDMLPPPKLPNHSDNTHL